MPRLEQAAHAAAIRAARRLSLLPLPCYGRQVRAPWPRCGSLQLVRRFGVGARSAYWKALERLDSARIADAETTMMDRANPRGLFSLAVARHHWQSRPARERGRPGFR